MTPIASYAVFIIACIIFGVIVMSPDRPTPWQRRYLITRACDRIRETWDNIELQEELRFRREDVAK